MTLEKKQEFTLKITQANKTQLITILYEMVIDYLDETIDEFAVGQREDAEKSVMHAQQCIDELIHSLNMEYDLARRTYQIYRFVERELIMADIRRDPAGLGEAEKIMKSLRDAYASATEEDSAEPIMKNTDTMKWIGLMNNYKHCAEEIICNDLIYV